MPTDSKFAVLIDADNIPDRYIKLVLDEIARDGIATFRRCYGDWTSSRLTGWKTVLLENAITPVQQYSYTFGKNATDSAMIIDAMDILYTGQVTGFCLVSSDSDFTRLAVRLRESGMQVVGMGESKTPKAFVNACNQFRYLDLLLSAREKSEVPSDDATQLRESPRPTRPGRKAVEAALAACFVDGNSSQTDLCTIALAIRDMVAEASGDDGWMFSGELGNRLAKRYPDFDVRNYGFYKLTPFLESLGIFEMRSTRTSGGNLLIYVRLKDDGIEAPAPQPAVTEAQ